MWEFSESESWRVHEVEVTGKLVAHKRRNLRHPVFQKTEGIPKLQEGNGQKNSTYPLKSCLAWTKSIRL